jgi:hypothetical protein
LERESKRRRRTNDDNDAALGDFCAGKQLSSASQPDQRRIVNSYTSRRTKRHAVALNSLNSEEIDNVMRIMPELLLVSRLPTPYIKPFVYYQQYLDDLNSINNATTDQQCDAIRRKFVRLVTSLQALDFTNLIGNVANNDAVDDGGDDANEDDDDDDEDEDERQTADNVVADDDQDDDDNDEDNVTRQSNWLKPKVLVPRSFAMPWCFH